MRCLHTLYTRLHSVFIKIAFLSHYSLRLTITKITSVTEDTKASFYLFGIQFVRSHYGVYECCGIHIDFG